MRRRRAALLALLASGCGLDLVGVALSGSAEPPSPAMEAGARVDAARPVIDAAPVRDAGEADASSCAACPAGTARSLCVAGTCTTTRRIFVTRDVFAATLASFTIADGKCTTAATTAGLGGTWRAWLSLGDKSSINRFDAGTVPYRLLDGTVVGTPAQLFPTTVSTEVQHAIDRDEQNLLVGPPSPVEVWTGTGRYGYGASERCADWTSALPATTGIVGLLDQSDYHWTWVPDAGPCSITAHLYCFEQ